jgi:NAD(P)-dependent dehydrogenase (short-subunit alcohol dehydrogenase family)
MNNRRIALVTGGSRGLGAATAEAVSRHGYDVMLTYREKAARAERVASQITSQGRRAVALRSNMAAPEDQRTLMRELAHWGHDQLDLLILNAAGGMERELIDDDATYPMRMNCDSQVTLVKYALPLMPTGSTIVFITSHWSHLYGQIQQLPWYEVIAATKHAGEQALRALQPELDRVGVRLLVVTGDLIDGTIMARMCERLQPGLTSAREASAGKLPTTDDAAEAIAQAANDPTVASGSTVVIGGSLQSIRDMFGGSIAG